MLRSAFTLATLICAVGSANNIAAQPATGKRDVTQTPLPVRGGAPGEIAILASCGRLLAHLTAGVTQVAWSPDGRLLASAFSDGSIKLWSMPEGVLKATLAGHSGTVGSLAFSPDGRTLASGSADRTIKLWSVADGMLKATLEGHIAGVDTLAFSRDGSLLASGSDKDDAIRTWSMPEGKAAARLAGRAKASLFLADGQYLTAYSPPMVIRFWSMPDGAMRRELRKPGAGSINALIASPDGRLLASGGSDGQQAVVQLWSMPDGKAGRALLGHFNMVTALSYRPDGGLLASASMDQSVKLWSMPQGTIRATLSGHLEGALSTAFSPDGGMLVVGSGARRGAIHLWSMPDAASTACLSDPSPAAAR